MIVGVVVPAHNEAARIAACLRSIEQAAAVAALRDVVVHIIVVCDACTDRTREIVESLGHRAVASEARNVGRARGLGADAALRLGARWLAFTDADTVVSPHWLADQLALESDVVCGTIGVAEWEAHDAAVRLEFEQNYRDEDGHRHIHGANLGMSAAVYRHVGGFSHLENSEDVAIVRALESAGACIAWSAQPRVVTSARPDFRATAGFGATIVAAAARLATEAVSCAVDLYRDGDASDRTVAIELTCNASAIARGLQPEGAASHALSSPSC